MSLISPDRNARRGSNRKAATLQGVAETLCVSLLAGPRGRHQSYSENQDVPVIWQGYAPHDLTAIKIEGIDVKIKWVLVF